MKKKMFYNLPPNRGYYTHNNMKRYKIGTNHYKRGGKGDLNKAIGLSLLLVIGLGSMFYACSKGINKHIENQDRMLCESAKISRNRKYLKKCQCYYQGGEIKCLQK